MVIVGVQVGPRLGEEPIELARRRAGDQPDLGRFPPLVGEVGVDHRPSSLVDELDQSPRSAPDELQQTTMHPVLGACTSRSVEEILAKTLIDLDEEALTLAMARYRTTSEHEAVNRALREVAGRHEQGTDDLADWFHEVGKRLAEVDPRTNAWRQWPTSGTPPPVW
jgi:Arc/MetJ family transcription regulator